MSIRTQRCFILNVKWYANKSIQIEWMASTWTYWPPDNARYAGDIRSTAVRRGVCDSDLTERASNCLVCRADDAPDTTVCWYQPDWRRQFVAGDLFYTHLCHLTAPGNYTRYHDNCSPISLNIMMFVLIPTIPTGNIIHDLNFTQCVPFVLTAPFITFIVFG